MIGPDFWHDDFFCKQGHQCCRKAQKCGYHNPSSAFQLQLLDVVCQCYNSLSDVSGVLPHIVEPLVYRIKGEGMRGQLGQLPTNITS